MSEVDTQSAERPPRRWVFVAAMVVSLTGVALLTSAGFASASASDPSTVAASGRLVLGVPLGTAVWVLLGVVGLIIGLTTVGRSRRRRHPQPSTAPADPGAVAA